MNLLLDTHTLLWLQDGDTRLSSAAQQHICNPANQRYLSIASVWEIAIKSGLNKLKLSSPFPLLMSQVMLTYKVILLPIALDDCIAYEQLSFPNPKHRDPFDRMIVTHALRNGFSVVGNDTAFDVYGITRLW